MSVYLITGRGGSGKSTLAKELAAAGYHALDTDKVPGLSRWENRKTGEPVEVDESAFVDFSDVSWNWNAELLNDLFEEYTDKTLFLCGSASNQEKFHDRFRRIFVLQVDPKQHHKRLLARGSDYGGHPDMAAYLVEEHQTFAQALLASGATPINVNGTLKQTVEEILSYAKDDGQLA